MKNAMPNAMMTIFPYRDRGLLHEPFVFEVPETIDQFVKMMSTIFLFVDH